MTEQNEQLGPWAKAVGKVSKAVFRVEIGDAGGTAFAVSISSEKGEQGHAMMLATANHVIEGASNTDPAISIISMDGELELDNTDSDIFLYRLGPEEFDTGLIVVRTKEPVLSLEDLTPVFPHEFIPARGAEVGWMGFPALAWPEPCFFKGALSGYLYDPHVYLIDGVAINGVSGGPVFNVEPTIFGIVSAYLPNRPDDETTLPGLMLVIPTTIIDYWISNVLGANGVPAA